ncbi:MAG: 50S ribosomal protein L17 [Candidatus Krumholzibacteriia bacterium]
MRHNVSGRKLGRSASHRRMLYRNLVTALFEHERIQTTVPKAKEARSLAEKLITFAKRGDLHARRQAARKINDPAVVQKLFDVIGPRFAERPGGYTRILRLSGGRKGDNAELAILELVDNTVRPKVVDTKKRKRARRVLEAEERAEAKAALQEAADERAQDERAAQEADEAAADQAPEEQAPEGEGEGEKKE